MKKILLIILDGLSDDYSGLNGQKTPLQKAHIPNLNYFARNGINGLIYPVRKGFVPETHTGMLSLLGYDVNYSLIRKQKGKEIKDVCIKGYDVDYSLKRGPIEAYGFTANGHDFDLAFRINFATLANENKIVDRRVCRDISQEEADILTEAVNSNVRLNGCQIEVASISTYRGILVIKRNSKMQLSDKISNTDPAYITEGKFKQGENGEYALQKCKPLDSSIEAVNTANLLNEFIKKSHSVLEKHEINELRKQKGKLPANIFLTRGVGYYNIPKLQPVNEKYNLNFGYITTLPIERGIGLLTDMEIIDTKSFGDINKNYEWLINTIINYSKRLDVLLVHIKGPDDAGHDKDFQKKIKIIEEIDKHLFGKLRKFKSDDFVICITSDHPTPCELGVHSDGKVPVTISGNIRKRDEVKEFNERSCKNGNLQIEEGHYLLPVLIDFAKESNK